MSRKNEIHILWILLTMFPIHIFSQTTRFYSPDRELSSSLITQLYQDKRGFVWVATEDGLNRLDGSLITIYRKKNNDSTSLKNNYVRTIFEDSSGHFWIGCINGLQLYNRSTDSFREIVLKKENGIRSYPHFTSIIERRNGDIWMATSGSGVITFPKGSLQYSNEVGLNKNLCSLFLTSLYEDSKGRIWMGSENNGFCCYLPETNSFLQFSGWENEIRNQAVSSFCELPDGAILIGTLTGGLYKYTSGGVIQTIQYERTQHPLAIKSLFVCRDGKILVGTDGMGFKLFNLETDKLQDYKLFSTPFDFSRTNVYSILEDKDENIWVGIFQKGVLLMPNHSSYFRYYGNKSFEHNLIGANCVMSIYKSRNGRLLIGTDNDGLYVLDENAQSVKHYPSNNLPSSVLSTVMCIHEARDGSIWLGTYLNGLARFDVNTGRCIYYPNRMGNHPANDKVYTIAEATDGKLWIGTYGNGIFRFDPKSGKFDAHYSQLHGLSNNWVNFMAWDNNNRLWIATYKGLSCFDPAMETFTNYYEKANGLPSNVVSSIAVATGGDIWLGTDAGIARLNLETDNISIYTTADGLSNDMICGIVEDAQKNIWISTHSGISKYSVVEHDFINYYAADGLQSNEFRRGAAHKAPDGEVFFGGINGVTCFYPQEIGIKERELDVFITGFYLFDKKIAYGPLSNGVEILDTTIMDAKHIKLNADNNVFSFEFSTLDYNNVSGITYRYHMEHFDNAWLITPQGVRRVTYTNLDPGTYQFSVQACELGNCSDVKTVTITIRPYWYMSVVAKIVYVLLAMLLVYGIYLFIRIRNHHRQEMLRQQHMEQINEAKLQFFTDISHEIRTPMTLIIGPLKKLMSDQNTNSDLQKSYQLIYRNAQRILRLINQLMDIRKIDRGQMSLKFRETDMVGFVLDVMQAFNSLAEQKNIRFSFRHDMPVLKAWIDLNNFDKVLFNLLSNAFKFTPDGGNIDITLSVGNDNSAEGLLKHYFEIQVCDTGIGIDQNRIEKIFERFYQIDHDVIQAGSGTGVGLHLSRSLVHMLHGTLTAQNNVDASGSTFIVRLPMGNAHLQKNEIENI